MHQLIRPEVIARGTGIYVGFANALAGAGPAVFGYLITHLQGQYWGGFAFLAAANIVGAVCYLTLYRISRREITAAAARRVATTTS